MIEIDQQDAFEWLRLHDDEGAVVTMLPDAAEVGMDLIPWRGWFSRLAMACLEASTGPTVFAQTDRKAEGVWISKAYMITSLAWRHGYPLLWHKVALRREVGQTDLHRPGYTHMLAFGPGKPGRATPDVLPPGNRAWRNGVADNVADMVAGYLADVGVDRMLNPCCGSGAFMWAAEDAGIAARGCDLDTSLARTMQGSLV